MAICSKCGVQNVDGAGVCGNCGTQMAQQQRQPQQPPQQQHPPPPTKSPLIAILVVVVVIIVVLACVLVFFMGGGGSGSPKGTFNSFVDEWNAEDWSGALHHTDAHFLSASDFNDAVDDFQGDADGDVTVNDIQTRNRDKMTSSEIDHAEDYIDDFEDEVSLNIDDYCMIDYTVTFEGDSDSDSMLCINVDGKWYVAMYMIRSSASIQTPLGLVQQGRTATTVNILIAYAPNDARVDGTQISLTQAGAPTAITSADVYWANATLAATYDGSSWTYQNGASSQSLEYNAGMQIMVTAPSISSGDTLTFSSSDDYFGTTVFTI